VKRCPGCDLRVETHEPGVSYTVLEPYGPAWHVACAEEFLREEQEEEPNAAFARAVQAEVLVKERLERRRLAHRDQGTAERIELADGEFKL